MYFVSLTCVGVYAQISVKADDSHDKRDDDDNDDNYNNDSNEEDDMVEKEDFEIYDDVGYN